MRPSGMMSGRFFGAGGKEAFQDRGISCVLWNEMKAVAFVGFAVCFPLQATYLFALI